MKSPIIMICVLFAGLLQAQNPYFAQFDMAPLSVNPALTGNFESRLRVNANYRNQWAQLLEANSYRTGQLSLDTKKSLGERTELGIGLFANYDRAGSLDWRDERYSISAALHHDLAPQANGQHRISLGMNAGIGHRSLSQDENSQIWPSSDTIISCLGCIDYSFVYPLVSTGLTWSYQSNKGLSAQAGIAAYGWNRPNMSFNPSNESKQRVFWSMFGQVEVPIGSRCSIIPALYYIKQSSQDQLTFGSFGRYYFKPDSDQRFVQIGVFGKTTRNPDLRIVLDQVASAMVRVQLDFITVGFSYDVHNLASNISTYELSLGYLLSDKK